MRLKTMYLAKDMRVPNPSYLENFDKVKWGDDKVCKKCWKRKCECAGRRR